MNAFTREDLKQFQSESLSQKEQRSIAKISEWFSYWNNEVYVAFSGGKDSSVLADLCGFWCSVIKATLYLCFVNTGLEYPEIQRHVKDFAEYLRKKYNIEVVLDILRPQMRFDEVIKKYGYPMIGKEVSKCVDAAKRLDSKYGQVCRQRLEGTYQKKNGEISQFNCEKYKPLLDVDCNFSHRCCDVMKTHLYDARYLVPTYGDMTILGTYNKFGANTDMQVRLPIDLCFVTPESVWVESAKSDYAFVDAGGSVYASDHNAVIFELKLQKLTVEPETEAPTEPETDPVTEAPAEPPAEETTATPSETEAPTAEATDAPTEPFTDTEAPKSGCGASLSLGALIALLPAAALFFRKRED